jgi:RNA polymerase-binding protein DksA
MGKLKKATNDKKKAVKKTEKKAVKTPAKKVKTVSKPAPKKVKKADLGNQSNVLTEIRSTVSFSKDVLEHFKNIITTQKKELGEEIESLTGRMLDSTAGEGSEDNSIYSLHMADQGTDAMEREKNYLFAQRNDDHIRRLDEALKRFDQGTFGICVVCGKLIEKERLEAVPTTQKHVDCKNQLKRLNREPLSY